ncbi:MAG: helix-turn-helix domain-containing protein, partial [Gemmatimonadetes bacterium]|nr:helix-turn-helix domain-containing protein [Gemmatimonadota bacterium]NNL29792.1 helix-turn-helix domain-containing protein [Gemmatimonadota bacterium]
IPHLEAVPGDNVRREIARALARASSGGARATVLRALGVQMPPPHRHIVRAALDGALLGWATDDLAAWAGWTRAHLSVRLKEQGLPSAGSLLLWARLLHASQWLSESGRSAESVSRQLGYSNGAVFRRALRNYVGATPTAVAQRGGLDYTLGLFLDECGLGDSVRDTLSVA